MSNSTLWETFCLNTRLCSLEGAGWSRQHFRKSQDPKRPDLVSYTRVLWCQSLQGKGLACIPAEKNCLLWVLLFEIVSSSWKKLKIFTEPTSQVLTHMENLSCITQEAEMKGILWSIWGTCTFPSCQGKICCSERKSENCLKEEPGF